MFFTVLKRLEDMLAPFFFGINTLVFFPVHQNACFSCLMYGSDFASHEILNSVAGSDNP